MTPYFALRGSPLQACQLADGGTVLTTLLPACFRSKYAYELCVTNALGGVLLPCNFDAALASGGGAAALTASPQLIGLLASCPVKGDDLLANMGYDRPRRHSYFYMDPDLDRHHLVHVWAITTPGCA